MGKSLKNLLTILVLTGISLSSAHGSQHSRTAAHHYARQDSAATSLIPEVRKESLMLVPGEQEKIGESVFLKLPEEKKSRQPESSSFVSEFRKEMNSLAVQLPDLSASWGDVSWYVRNPLRYKLSPGSTYEHQFGLTSGKWVLSIDGIGMTSLDDLDVSLQYPFGKNMSLYLRYNDMQYKLNIQATGKLPWE